MVTDTASRSRGARFLYALLLKPRSRDEDVGRREFILNVLLLGSIAMLLVLDAGVLYHTVTRGDAYQEIGFGVFSLIPLFFIVLYALSRRGYAALASYLFLGAYFLSNSYAMWRWGMTLPTAALGYAIIIFIAGILVSTRFAILVTAAVAAYIIPLWHFQLAGVVPTQAHTRDANDAVVFSAIYGIFTVVAWLSNREMERSLRRARQSEIALKEERDQLDIKVEERTRELRHSQLEQMDQLYRFAEFGQLASGLFHDLVNMVSAATLRAEPAQVRDAPREAYRDPVPRSVHDVQGRIDRFMQAIRKQLANQDAQESFSLVESVEQALQLLAYKALDRGVRMRFERPGDPLMRFGNPFRFHQVVVNLLQNAIECFEDDAPEDGRQVVVRLRADGTATVLEVEDNGCGIPPELEEKVFEPFFTTRAGTGGMGIGLATSRKIVERDFGGTIGVRGNRRGTTFSVSIPAEAPARP